MKFELRDVVILLTYILVLLGMLSRNHITILVGIFLILGQFYTDWRKKNETE